jgi:hypothetical protein
MAFGGTMKFSKKVLSPYRFNRLILDLEKYYSLHTGLLVFHVFYEKL